MTLFQSFGFSLPLIVLFFGVLALSISMAVVAVLADY
jgi:hypothetical protein